MIKFTSVRHMLPALLLLAAGLICITVGVLHGESRIVLIKAINICLECVGIG